MKKILLLLLISVYGCYGQTLQNPTYGTVKITNNTVSTTAPFIGALETNGAVNKINKSDLIEYLEYTTASALPVTGTAGKIYCTKDDNKLYRWTGLVYQEVSAGSGSYTETDPIVKAINGIVKSNGTTISAASAGDFPTLNQNTTGTAGGLSANIAQSQVTNLVSNLASKAPLASPTFTGTVSGITKSMVGLGNVDNTTDANKPISTATQTALNLKANSASPNFSGDVSAGSGNFIAQGSFMTGSTGEGLKAPNSGGVLYPTGIGFVSNHPSVPGWTSNAPITAPNFIKSGGLSTEYLMADGSVTTGGGSVNTAFNEVTYSSTISHAFDSANPNIFIDITGNLDLTYTGTANGDSGMVNLYFAGTQTATINGTKSLNLTGDSTMIPIFFVHDDTGIRWYDGRDDLSIEAEKSNLPEIALNRYRSIPNNANRRIAWVGDSVTMHTGFSMIDSRDSSTRTLDTSNTFTITDISASGVCTSNTAHNLLYNSIIQATTTANGFVSNSYYYVSEVTSTTEFKIVNVNFGAVTLTAGTGLSIGISFASFYDNNTVRYPSAPMYKVTNGAFGANGNTASNFLASIGNPAINLGFEQVVNFAPNLIVYSYGINDVRLGGTTQAQLEGSISSTIEAFQTRLPNTDIILRMPNHLCYDSATLTAYLGAGTTLAQAQFRSDILRLAYQSMKAKYAHVYVLDTQEGETAIFTKKIPTTTNIYMSDCLHPTLTDGQGLIFREVLLSLGEFGNNRVILNSEPPKFYPNLPKGALADATATSSTTDYLITPRIVEDPMKYNLLFKGATAASAKGSYWDVKKYKTGVAEAKNYTNVIKSNDIAIVYGTLEYTSGSQGEYFDNGVAAFKLTTANVGTQGNNFRITSLPAGYPMANGGIQEVAFYRAKPISQLRPANNDFNEVISFIDFTPQTTHKIIEQFSVCAVITGISNTAPTTGGTITLNKNGVAFATLTWADGVATATGSGTFFTDGTRGVIFEEGDVLSFIVNSGFVGGTLPKIRLSNK